MRKNQVIAVAQQKLLDEPFDIVHDVFHHYQVWENVLLLVTCEDLSLDLDTVEIATWWHDFERGSSQHST
jgi:hypothetical protein